MRLHIAKIKSSRNCEITLSLDYVTSLDIEYKSAAKESDLSFTKVGKSCLCREFLTSQMFLLTLFEKIKFSIF